MKTIDLHVHSLVSDGSMTPAEIARHAHKIGLSAFALTDHDVIAGTAAARNAAAREGIEFINGMELSAEYHGQKIHIICLGFDENNPAFKTLYERIRAIKEGKIPEIIDFIHRRGIDISLEKVKPFIHGDILDRYAIMRYLVSLNLYDRAQPLWDNYINPAVAALGLNFSITAEEALPLIHKAGGVTSLAHYHKAIGLKGMTRREQETAILHLHAMGLDGMEKYYPSYTKEDAAFAAYMIDKYKLLATGGTDFHGANRPGIELGTGLNGNLAIPYEILSAIKERLYKSNK